MLQLAYARHSSPRSNASRATGVLFAAALHAGVIYAVMVTVKFVPMPVAFDPIVARLIPQPTDEPLPSPLPPVVRPLPIPVPVPPETPIIEIAPPVGPTNAINVPPPPAMPAQEAPPVALPFAPARAIASTQTTPAYPPISRRLGEQGVVRLGLTIGADGMVRDIVVNQTSGFPRLDAAATDWIKRHWRYEPAVRGAMPVEDMTELTVRFRLD